MFKLNCLWLFLHHLHPVSFQVRNLDSLVLIQHFFPVCDPNYFQTPPDYSWTSRPVLISTADVFKSLGSLKWNTEDGWKHNDLYWDRHSPVSQKYYTLSLKRSATHKHFLFQSTTSLHYACFSHFSFTLVYTAALKRRASFRPAITLMENMSG